jgi:hypothetical protein
MYTEEIAAGLHDNGRRGRTRAALRGSSRKERRRERATEGKGERKSQAEMKVNRWGSCDKASDQQN